MSIAIKELKTHQIQREPYQRFRDEVSFHIQGPHPGVLPILDANVPESPSRSDPAWLAMPIAETVRTTLGPDSTLDEVVDAVRVYAATLARLAQGGIHHRDLKPDNLFRLSGAWVVGDFGLVTWPGKQALTEPGQKLGPAHYVAPEMVEDPARADAGPADVWSLAKVLWVLASGQNYPLPGHFRIDDPSTVLRNQTSHPRAAGLEAILEQATRIVPSDRPTMEEFAKELEMWSTPADPARGPASVEDLIARVHAITAPAVAAAQERTDLRREASALAGRLRAAHNTLRPTMERLGRVFPPSNGEEGGGLILQGLGGKSGRRDVAATWSESLTLVPPSPQHKVGLTVDVAWELFETWDIHLVVGMYLRSGADLPEVFMLETRDARVGTEHASRTADSLAQMVVDSFAAAANRYADLLDAEEARIQSSRQPRLESAGTNYTFQTQPEAGVITIIRRADGSVDGHAIAWLGAPLTEIRADGDRLFVRAGDKQGWIEQNSAQNWVLAPLRPTDSEGEVPEHPNSETSCRGG